MFCSQMLPQDHVWLCVGGTTASHFHHQATFSLHPEGVWSGCTAGGVYGLPHFSLSWSHRCIMSSETHSYIHWTVKQDFILLSNSRHTQVRLNGLAQPCKLLMVIDNGWCCPLLATKHNASVRNFRIGFSFQTQKLCASKQTVVMLHAWHTCVSLFCLSNSH